MKVSEILADTLNASAALNQHLDHRGNEVIRNTATAPHSIPGTEFARWDVDFSLALFNRTGKYFIGQDIILQNADVIDKINFWRWTSASPPEGIPARILGKLESLEHRARTAIRLAPKAAPDARCLHLDPLTILHRRLSQDDLVLCHDLGPITHPHLFAKGVSEQYDFAYRLIRDAQPGLVFVSKASEAAFAELYGAPRQSHVIYPPIRAGSLADQSEPCEEVRPPFLLTVGSLGWRKNQASAIKAFQLSGLADQGFSYVLCGEREPGSEEVIALAKQVPGVIVLPYVSEANLRWLYDEAAGFVLVSHLEGFGMPVAEAMARKLIPIVSENSVLEEVAGSGAITVSPDSVEEIAAAMTAVTSMDDASRAQRIALFDAQIAQFSEEAFRRQWRALLAD
jgi:glycosyltransferase involved in cell wall biosynthesis